MVIFLEGAGVGAVGVCDAFACAARAGASGEDLAGLRDDFVCEDFDELWFLRAGGVGNVVGDEDGAEAGDGEGGGVEFGLQVVEALLALVVGHDGVGGEE